MGASAPAAVDSAPALICVSTPPIGNRLVATKSANVKPHDVASATTTRSRQVIGRGRRQPAATAIPTATTIPPGRPTSAAASTAHVPVSYAVMRTPAFTSPNKNSTPCTA